MLKSGGSGASRRPARAMAGPGRHRERPSAGAARPELSGGGSARYHGNAGTPSSAHVYWPRRPRPPGHVGTPRSSNRRCSAPSRAALVPRSPDTTRAAHRKYSCTRSADHPAGRHVTSFPAPTQTETQPQPHCPRLPLQAQGSPGAPLSLGTANNTGRAAGCHQPGSSPSPRCRCRRRGRYLAGYSGSGPAGCTACPPV